jgi:cyclopropane fatty-acyl-phospholipid synthase-like methyltransferase
MTSQFSVPSDWYKTFFTDPVFRFWEAVIPPEATQAEVAFIMRHVGVSPPASIADVPCGTGRHALALAKEGFRVTAIDGSVEALQRAQTASQTGLSVCFLRSDMLEFEVDPPVDALICMGNSIGYFEPGLTQELLRRFASALRSGGRLIVDTGICAESLLPISPERRFTFPSGSYEQEMTYDVFQSTINTRARLTIEGESHELRYRHFVMTSGELVRLMRSEGFNICALYGDANDAAFGPGSPRLLLVAVKK